MTMRCDQCRHWGNPNERPWEASEIGFKQCMAVKERWEIQDAVVANRPEPFVDEAAQKWTADRKKALSDARAYVEDGSEYHAALITGPDFFCGLFQERGNE